MTQLARLAPFAVASASLVFACVSTPNGPGAPGTDGGPGAEGGTVATGDAGPGGTDGGGGGFRVANISLGQQVTSGTTIYTASAGFGTLIGQAGKALCTSQTFGACTVSRCPITDAGLPASTAESAGKITITGAGSSSAVLTFDGTTGRYTEVQGSTAFYKGGDTITVVGAGAAVPSFAAPTVIAPSDVTFTAPACVGTACPDIDRTKDMTMAWTGGGAGDVDIVIETTSDVLNTNLACTFKASLGSGTAPAAAMALLDKADGTTITAVEIMFPIAQTQFAVGSYPAVSFVVQGSGTEGFAKMAN